MAQHPFAVINKPRPFLLEIERSYPTVCRSGFNRFFNNSRWNICRFRLCQYRNSFHGSFCRGSDLFRRLLRCCCLFCRGSRCGGTGFTFLALFLDSFWIAPFDHVPEHDLGNLQHAFEFGYSLRCQNHINECVETIAVALNGICQSAPSPLINFHNLTAIGCDDLFDTILNGAYLFFVDFGIENEREFVVSSHEATSFLWVYIRSGGFCSFNPCRSSGASI